MRRGILKGLARPRAHPLIVARIGPATVHVHDVVRIAADKGSGRRFHARHRTAELGHEDLALRSRQAAGGGDHEVERRIAQRAEVVRLPVVAAARCQQRIEGGLERGVGRRPQRASPIGIAELQHRGGGALAGFDIAAVDKGKDHHLGAVGRCGKERQRRRLAQHRPHAQFVGRAGGEVAPRAQDLAGLCERVDDQAGVDLGADRMQLELERGHHAEVAAAAAQGPEQVGLRGGRDDAHGTVGRHDGGAEQIVDGHAMAARQPAEAAAERESGNAGGGIDAERRGQAVGLRLRDRGRPAARPGRRARFASRRRC